MKTATVEEVKKMKKEAEKKIGKILTELAECGVYVGNVHTYQYQIDKDGQTAHTTTPVGWEVTTWISLHFQEKPNWEK